jgi:addiction module HigA family antidote
VKIRNILHKGLKRLYAEDSAKGVPPDATDKLRKMLAFLDDMQDPEELRALPSWKVHTLTGDRKGSWSLSVTRNRRLTFRIDTAEREICDMNLKIITRTEGEHTMPMKNPPHPGDFIRTEIIAPAGLSVTAAAAALQVSRPALSSLLNGKADLSGDMALRIEKALGVKMDTLMRMQASYDIAQTRKREKSIHVRRISQLVHA